MARIPHAWQLVLVVAVAAASAQREKGPGKRYLEQKRNNFGGASSVPQQYGYGPWGGPPFGPYATPVSIQPEKLVLNCAVHGYSGQVQPVQWLKLSGPGLVATPLHQVFWDRRHYSVQQTALGSRLVLTNPQPRHLGTYICRSGHDTSAPFTVGRERGTQPWVPLLRGVGRSGGGGSIRAEQSPPLEPAQEVQDGCGGTRQQHRYDHEQQEEDIEEVERARSARPF